MPRTARIVGDDAVFHITQRGNNKQVIFKDNDDYEVFLEVIKKYKGEIPFELYNYNLIPNHIHLLMRNFKGKCLSKIFQGIFQSYAIHHKKKYGYIGRLYQDRFKSSLIDSDSYLLECARYIERNPLKHKITKSLDEHKWSSYHYYAKGAKNELLTPNPLYLELSKKPRKRKSLYFEYLLQVRPSDLGS